MFEDVQIGSIRFGCERNSQSSPLCAKASDRLNPAKVVSPQSLGPFHPALLLEQKSDRIKDDFPSPCLRKSWGFGGKPPRSTAGF